MKRKGRTTGTHPSSTNLRIRSAATAMAAVIAEATGAAVIAKWAKAIYELPVEATVCASGQVTIVYGPRSTAIGTKSRHEIPEG